MPIYSFKSLFFANVLTRKSYHLKNILKCVRSIVLHVQFCHRFRVYARGNEIKAKGCKSSNAKARLVSIYIEYRIVDCIS